MKKFNFVMLAILLASTAVLTQESDADVLEQPRAERYERHRGEHGERYRCERGERRRGERAERPQPQLVTVEGALLLRDGRIALVTVEDTAYYVPGLWRYVGFIDGLKEGAHVFITGHSFGEFLQPSRLTLGGKTYDLATADDPRFGERGRRHGHGSMRQSGERERRHGYHNRHESMRRGEAGERAYCPRQGESRHRLCEYCPRARELETGEL
ncbi:MAG: hypothetical protein LBU70_07675 [Chitinispirillales bacterium]|nr:hypothetical protein [Chitinispirillales bacterium]